MDLTKEEIIRLIKKEKLLITILFFISTCFGSTLIFLSDNQIFLLVGLFCYMLAVLCLPKINGAKQDIQDTKNNIFDNFSGKVEDIFPEKENKETGRWIVLIQDNEGKKTYEYLLRNKINLAEGEQISIYTTKYTKIPTKIERVVE
jgi:hypothetical protein